MKFPLCLNKPFLTVTLKEKPIAQQRPRLARGHIFNPNAEQKEAHGWIFKEAMMHAHKNCTDKPVIVDFHFFFKRLKSSPVYMTQRVDLDNIIKFYQDAMSTIVYDDDKRIISLTARKEFAPENSVSITIYEV
jgi:Holliday junction resolvase RusA-like endonuclease